MYEERKDKFSVKDLVLQILVISLFVFLLLWLFPTKSDLNKIDLGSNKNNNDTNSVLYDRIFNENIIAMKDAAKSYYTTPRLPQNVGDKVKMTLGEMLDKKIILPFTDKNGKACDKEKSYVEITKENEEEYIMKVNLKCSSEENYLLVYMGCYDYCKTTVCEKNKEDVATPIIRKVVTPQQSVTNIVNNITNIVINQVCPDCNPTPTPTPMPPDPTKEYICEYIKVTNGSFSNWSSWSDWTDTQQYPTQLKQVKSKTIRTTVDQKILTGYNVITYRDENKPIYKQVQVQSGTKTEKVCASYGTRVEPNGSYVYGAWQDAGLVKLYDAVAPSDASDTVRYIWVSSGTDNCENCDYRAYNVYRKQTRTKTAGTHNVTYCTGYTTKTIPLYKTVNVLTGYGTSEKREPVYKNVQSVVDKKYYSYRTRKVTGGSQDIKWDVCEGSSLVNDGYSPTGNKKEK